MTALATSGITILGVFTLLWREAYWRIMVRSSPSSVDFDTALAIRFRLHLAGIAIIAVWLGVLLHR
jgi:hypothetical protein